ncbi:L,D-transpeptidase [Enterovirga sp.]|uniref:L,D-transpeptidase n=1 Tax=Enterovirga sp. TaxID=2026350 RepID=UPI002CD63BCC|nr:L,D-transpeptidase [Enterovirga sp.]HMO31171.1 L,D-transpeptidase [Enterovirga sp.]
MRHHFLVPLGLAAMLAATDASAQVAYNVPGGRGGLGGGLIEFLVTGREPGRSAAPVYNSRGAGGARAMAPDPYRGSDPFADPPAYGRRLAALPSDPGGELIARTPRAEYLRRDIAYSGPEAPGTIIVDTPSKFLYHILPGGRATRYGIGVGRPGFEWSGIKTITRKAEWPGWTPPPEMLKRRPDLPRHMEGGPGNPLGARALYLGSSLYRIHGTNEPHTIGQNVSSGCIRMMNDDIVHLYERVGVGTRVKVI